MGGIADYSGALVLQLPLDRVTTVSVQRQAASRCDVVSRRGDGRVDFGIDLEPIVDGPSPRSRDAGRVVRCAPRTIGGRRT